MKAWRTTIVHAGPAPVAGGERGFLDATFLRAKGGLCVRQNTPIPKQSATPQYPPWVAALDILDVPFDTRARNTLGIAHVKVDHFHVGSYMNLATREASSLTWQMPLYKRPFDLVCAVLLILIFSPLLIATALAVKVTSNGSILHWSKRVGRHNRIFRMPKFRSMRMDTPQLPTHLMTDPCKYVTPIGRFLRLTSLDELPQLFSVMAGDLSLVGPRPALFNQTDLVALRTEYGLHELIPGITGWAQVNGRDELPIPSKVAFDYEYLQKLSFFFDIKILLMTAMRVVLRNGISH